MNRTALYRLTGLLLAGTMLSVPFATEAADIRVQTLNIAPSIPHVAAPPPSITSRVALPPSKLRIPDGKSGGTKKIVKSPVKTGKTKTVTTIPAIKDGKVKGAAQTTSKKEPTFTGKANFKATATAKVLKPNPKVISEVKYTATVKAGGMVVPRGNSTGSGHASAQPYDEFREANAPAGGNLAVATMKIDEVPLLRNAGVGFALAEALGDLKTAGLGAPGDIFGAWNPDGTPAFSVHLPDKDLHEGLSPAGIEDPREAGPTFLEATGGMGSSVPEPDIVNPPQPGGSRGHGNGSDSTALGGAMDQTHTGGGGFNHQGLMQGGRLGSGNVRPVGSHGSVVNLRFGNGDTVTTRTDGTGRLEQASLHGGAVNRLFGMNVNANSTIVIVTPGPGGAKTVTYLIGRDEVRVEMNGRGDIERVVKTLENGTTVVKDANGTVTIIDAEGNEVRPRGDSTPHCKPGDWGCDNGNPDNGEAEGKRQRALAAFITREWNGQPAPQESDGSSLGLGFQAWINRGSGGGNRDCYAAFCGSEEVPGTIAPGGGMAAVFARVVSVTNPPRN